MFGLDAYLDAALAEPWAWGRMDCCAFCGRWIEAATGKDALGAYRGLYHTASGARRLIVERGGLLAMVEAEMVRCGFERTQQPDHGDIAVIASPQQEVSVAGAAVVIRHASWWIARSITGIVGFDVEPLAAWSIR